MRKILIIALVIFAALAWGKSFLQNGRMDRILDRYGNPSFNAAFEYYWGLLLELSSRTPGAMDRFNRLQKKYPKSSYDALSRLERINILDQKGDRPGVLKEGEEFLKKYSSHPKAELIRKKISIIEHGI